MVSTRPPTSKSSNPFNNLLVTIPNALITIGIISMVFSIPNQDPDTYPSSHILSALFCGQPGQQSQQFCKFSFFFFFFAVVVDKVWSSGGD